MQNTNTELRLENVERDDHFLSIRTDISGKPMMELIIVYADGKEHKITPKGLKQEVKCSEVRMIVSPFMLQTLITELQMHQKKLNNITKNADQLSSLVKHITSEE